MGKTRLKSKRERKRDKERERERESGTKHRRERERSAVDERARNLGTILFPDGIKPDRTIVRKGGRAINRFGRTRFDESSRTR